MFDVTNFLHILPHIMPHVMPHVMPHIMPHIMSHIMPHIMPHIITPSRHCVYKCHSYVKNENPGINDETKVVNARLVYQKCCAEE